MDRIVRVLRPWLNIRMRIHEVLDHSTRLLFHGTLFLRLPEILEADALLDKTSDLAGEVRHSMGVSLTRSYEFARTHRRASRSVVLVLDARMLRTSPVAYWGGRGSRTLERADEMEEFHRGAIRPLSRFLVSINSPVSYPEWIERVAATEPSPYPGMADIGALARRGFPAAQKLWNRWAPVRGIDRTAGRKPDQAPDGTSAAT